MKVSDQAMKHAGQWSDDTLGIKMAGVLLDPDCATRL